MADPFFISFQSNIEAEANAIISRLTEVDEVLERFAGRARSFEIDLGIDDRQIEQLRQLSSGDISIGIDGRQLRDALANALASTARGFGDQIGAALVERLRGSVAASGQQERQRPSIRDAERAEEVQGRSLTEFLGGVDRASTALAEFTQALRAASQAARTPGEAGSGGATADTDERRGRRTASEVDEAVSRFVTATQRVLLAFQEGVSIGGGEGGGFEVQGQFERSIRSALASGISDAFAGRDLAGQTIGGSDDIDEPALGIAIARAISAAGVTVAQESGLSTDEARSSLLGAEEIQTLISYLSQATEQPNIGQDIAEQITRGLASARGEGATEPEREGARAARDAADAEQELSEQTRRVVQAKIEESRSTREVDTELERFRSSLRSIGGLIRELGRSQELLLPGEAALPPEEQNRLVTERQQALDVAVAGRTGGQRSTRATYNDLVEALASRVGTPDEALRALPDSSNVRAGSEVLGLTASSGFAPRLADILRSAVSGAEEQRDLGVISQLQELALRGDSDEGAIDRLNNFMRDFLGREFDNPDMVRQIIDALQAAAVQAQARRGPTDFGERPGDFRSTSLQEISTIRGARRTLPRDVTLSGLDDDQLLRAGEAAEAIANRRRRAVEQEARAQRQLTGYIGDFPVPDVERARAAAREAPSLAGIGGGRQEEFLRRAQGDLLQREQNLRGILAAGVEDEGLRSVLTELAEVLSAGARGVGQALNDITDRLEQERQAAFQRTAGLSAASGRRSTIRDLLGLQSPEGRTIGGDGIAQYLTERFGGDFRSIRGDEIDRLRESGVGGERAAEQAREFNALRQELISRVEQILSQGARDIEGAPPEQQGRVRAQVERDIDRELFPTRTEQEAEGFIGIQRLIEERRGVLNRQISTDEEQLRFLRDSLAAARESGSGERTVASLQQSIAEIQQRLLQAKQEALSQARRGVDFGVPVASEGGQIRADATDFLRSYLPSFDPALSGPQLGQGDRARLAGGTQRDDPTARTTANLLREFHTALQRLPQLLADAGGQDFLGQNTEFVNLLRSLVSSELPTPSFDPSTGSGAEAQERAQAQALTLAARLQQIPREVGQDIGGLGPLSDQVLAFVAHLQTLTSEFRESPAALQQLQEVFNSVFSSLPAQVRSALGGEEIAVTNREGVEAVQRLLAAERALAALRRASRNDVQAGNLDARNLSLLGGGDIAEQLRTAALGAGGLEDIPQALNRVLQPMLDRAFQTGQEQLFGEQVGPRVAESELESRITPEQLEAARALRVGAEAQQAAAEQEQSTARREDGAEDSLRSVLRELSRGIRELVECCHAMRGLLQGQEGIRPSASAFGGDFINDQTLSSLIPGVRNQPEIASFINALSGARGAGGGFQYTSEDVAGQVRQQFGGDSIPDEDAFRRQLDAARQLATASRQTATNVREVGEAGEDSAQQVEAAFRRSATRIADVYGRGGIVSRSFEFIGLFVSREIAGSLVFGVQAAARRVGREILEIQDQIVRVQQALEALGQGQDAAGAQGALTRVSSDVGIPLSDVTQTASSLVGVFQDIDQVEFATRIVSQLQLISNGALNAQEGFRSIQSIVSAFGIETAGGLQRVADVSTQLQNLTSVNIEDTIEGVAALAEQARSLNLSLEQTATLTALVARGTGQTGSSAAEQFGRILSGFSDPGSLAVLRELRDTEGVEIINRQALSARQYGDVLVDLIANFDQLSDVQQNLVRNELVSDRQARAFEALISQRGDVRDLLGDITDTSAGAAERRFQVLVDNLNGQLQRLGTRLTNLISSLADLGLIDPLTTVLGLLNDIVGAVGDIVSLFNSASETIPGLGAAVNVASIVGLANLMRRFIPQVTRAVRAFAGSEAALVGATVPGAAGATAAARATQQPLVTPTQRAATTVGRAAPAGVPIFDPSTGRYRQGGRFFAPSSGQLVHDPRLGGAGLRRVGQAGLVGSYALTQQRLGETRLGGTRLGQAALGRAGQGRLGQALLRNLPRAQQGVSRLASGIGRFGTNVATAVGPLGLLAAGLVTYTQVVEAARRAQNDLNTIIEIGGGLTADEIEDRRREQREAEATEAATSGGSALDALQEGRGFEQRFFDSFTAGFQGITRGRGFFGGAKELGENVVDVLAGGIETGVRAAIPGLADRPAFQLDPDEQSVRSRTGNAVNAEQDRVRQEFADLQAQVDAGTIGAEELAQRRSDLIQSYSEKVSEIVYDSDLSDAEQAALLDRALVQFGSDLDQQTGQLLAVVQGFEQLFQLSEAQVTAINEAVSVISGSNRGFRAEYGDVLQRLIDDTGLEEGNPILEYLDDLSGAEGDIARSRIGLEAAIAQRQQVLGSDPNEFEDFDEAVLSATQRVEEALNTYLDATIAIGQAGADLSERFGDYEDAVSSLSQVESTLESRLARLDRGSQGFFDTLNQLLDVQARQADLAIQGTQDTLRVFEALSNNQGVAAEAGLIAAEQRFEVAVANAGAFSQEEITSRFVEVIDANTTMVEALAAEGSIGEVTAEARIAKFNRDRFVDFIKTASIEQKQALLEALQAGESIPRALATSGIAADFDQQSRVEGLLQGIENRGEATANILQRVASAVQDVNNTLQGTLSVVFASSPFSINIDTGGFDRERADAASAARYQGQADQHFERTRSDTAASARLTGLAAHFGVTPKTAEDREAEQARTLERQIRNQIPVESFRPQGETSARHQAAEDAKKAAEEAEQRAEQLRQAIAATAIARIRNPVRRAQRELTEALRRVAYTRGRDAVEYQQALQQEIQARQSLADALQAQQQALFGYREAVASAAGNNLRAAQIALRAATDQVAFAIQQFGAGSTEALNAAAAQVAAEANVRDTALQEQLATIDFQLEIGKITENAAIRSLQQILRTAELTEEQRRNIILKIKGLQESIQSALSAGFNIGEITLPTPLQVRRSLGLDPQSATFGQTTQVTQSVQISNEFIVQNANDPNAVARAISREIQRQFNSGARGSTSTPNIITL